jgi:hypothetical protein
MENNGLKGEQAAWAAGFQFGLGTFHFAATDMIEAGELSQEVWNKLVDGARVHAETAVAASIKEQQEATEKNG